MISFFIIHMICFSGSVLPIWIIPFLDQSYMGTKSRKCAVDVLQKRGSQEENASPLSHFWNQRAHFSTSADHWIKLLCVSDTHAFINVEIRKLMN